MGLNLEEGGGEGEDNFKMLTAVFFIFPSSW